MRQRFVEVDLRDTLALDGLYEAGQAAEAFELVGIAKLRAVQRASQN